MYTGSPHGFSIGGLRDSSGTGSRPNSLSVSPGGDAEHRCEQPPEKRVAGQAEEDHDADRRPAGRAGARRDHELDHRPTNTAERSDGAEPAVLATTPISMMAGNPSVLDL